MTSPDLSRRVDHQAEDIRVISDLVLDVKGTVDELKVTVDRHTVTLAELRRDVTEVKGTLADQGKLLAEILGLLRQGR